MRKCHKIGPNKFPSIFGCPKNDQTKIWIYSDFQELTKQMSEYIWMLKKWPNEMIKWEKYRIGSELTKVKTKILKKYSKSDSTKKVIKKRKFTTKQKIQKKN